MLGLSCIVFFNFFLVHGLTTSSSLTQKGVWRRAFNGNQIVRKQEGSEHLHLHPIQPRQQHGIQHQENLIGNTVLNNNEYKDKNEAYPNIFNLLTDVAFRNKGFVQENLESELMHSVDKKNVKRDRTQLRLSLSNNLDILREKLLKEISRKSMNEIQEEDGLNGGEDARIVHWKKMKAMIQKMKMGGFQEQRAVRANIQRRLYRLAPSSKPIHSLGK
ncbi:uncharacterized protein LOC111696301 [Eurytemora carolleeae]|uniref:uncharacterized protein LOC111696301 n=1 Tax=Eurytemora carolleeae TaxID=1294199 RepID=UPI000C7890E6|nr:uncharacterized protein LOC111696301 [Eurytemora carolleeae]|eukprot:XP_023321639.1 uncharacterized protein LOC111696301 [Eurytemora affinis]